MANSSVSQSDFFYGWSLLFKTIEKTVNKKADIVIALTHFVFTKHSSFRCVGIGDSKVLEEDEHGSELLPDDYNEDDSKYALRYVYNGVLYILLGHITEGSLVINLLNVKDKSVSNICVEPCELVVNTKGSLEEMIPTASAFADRLRKEILDPVFGGNTREDGTQTTCTSTSRDSQPDPLRIGEPRRPMGQFSPEGLEPRPFGFPDVGRGDLDPLGRGGPGNLFEFPRRPDMRGGLQPRFDPFGPPERNLRPNPNPDHFQPPGFGGDHYL